MATWLKKSGAKVVVHPNENAANHNYGFKLSNATLVVVRLVNVCKAVLRPTRC